MIRIPLCAGDIVASVDKGIRACERDWPAVCRVIVLGIRQYGLGPKERASADLTV